MAITFPTHQEIADRMRTDVSSQLPTLDPTIYGTVISAIIDSIAGRIKDLYDLQEQLLKQFFPQTAEGEYLERFAEPEGLTRNPATIATGEIVFTGTASTEIPAGTEMTNSDGDSYTTDELLTLANQNISITSLTRTGTTATATVTSTDSLASNTSLVISGANETAYNGTFTITITSTTTFTYTLTGSPSTPATGTILGSYTGGNVAITSDSAGEDQNLDSGSKLTLTTPITGVDNSAYVTFNEISGGTDVETDEELRNRIMQSRANPVTNFNSTAIEKQAKTISGVTRVKVYEVTPEIGDVTVLFTRDNDDNIIPDAAEVAEVKAAIVEIMPANTEEDFVYVQAPVENQVDFAFSSLTPSATTMKTAIQTNLAAFFSDEVDIGETITRDRYRGVIINTIDPDTGDRVTSFELSYPTDDITVSGTGLATLGTITF